METNKRKSKNIEEEPYKPTLGIAYFEKTFIVNDNVNISNI